MGELEFAIRMSLLKLPGIGTVKNFQEIEKSLSGPESPLIIWLTRLSESKSIMGNLNEDVSPNHWQCQLD